MDVGDAFLWAAAVSAAAAAALSGLRAWTRAPAYETHARLAILAALLGVLGASVLLLAYLADSRMAYAYVHRLTSTDLPLAYKVSAFYTGQEGSFLLWALFLAGLLVAVEFVRPVPGSAAFRNAFRAGNALVLLALVGLVLHLGLFRPTAPVDLLEAPGGRGLNTLLVTPFTLVHPPLQFLAYAAAVLPATAAAGFLATGESRWSDACVTAARASWLLFTLALGIGGLWSYNVLGWGGYWAWDPVETEDLLPWLAATALLHALVFHRRQGAYFWTAPLLGLLLLVVAVFATFVTKTGFVDSPLHTFTLPQVEVEPFGEVIDLRALGAGDRLVAMTTYVPSARYLASLLVVLLGLGGGLYVARFARVRAREGHRSAFPLLYLGGLAALVLWAALAPGEFFASGLALAGAVGGGSAALGTVVLGGLLVGLPLAWILTTAKEETSRPHSLDSVGNDRNLSLVTVTLTTLWLVAVVALMIQGARGLQPGVFESRLPLVLLPAGAALFVYATYRYVGVRRALIATAALGAAALLGAALTGQGLFVLYAGLGAATLVALSAHLDRLLGASDPRRRLSTRLLAFSGLAGLVFWASHPSGLLALSWTPSLALDLLGLLASLLALLGAFAVAAGAPRRVAALSALAGIAALGFLVGAGAAATAGVLSAKGGGGEWRRRFRSLVRSAAPHIVHAGALLLVIGYAASTYGASTEEFTFTTGEVEVGPPRLVGGYLLALTASASPDTDGDGFVDAITAAVAVSGRGAGTLDATILARSIPGDPGNASYEVFTLERTGGAAVRHGAATLLAVRLVEAGNWTLPRVGPKLPAVTVSSLTLSVRFFEGVAADSPRTVFGSAVSLGASAPATATEVAPVLTVGTRAVPLLLRFDAYAGLYRGEPTVLTGSAGDLYLAPVAVAVEGTWVLAGDGGPRSVSGEITAVAFIAREVPGMPALWGGLSWMAVGMATRVLADLPRGASRSRAGESPD